MSSAWADDPRASADRQAVFYADHGNRTFKDQPLARDNRYENEPPLWPGEEISSNVVINSNEEQGATRLELRGAKVLNVHTQPTYWYSIKWQRATEGDSHALPWSRQWQHSAPPT